MKTLSAIITFAAYALFSGSGLIVLKIAMTESTERSLSLLQLLFRSKFLIGFILYACGFVLWMFILSKFKLNIAFPIAISLFFIISSLGSYFLLKESFTIMHIIGISLCLAGILMISLK